MQQEQSKPSKQVTENANTRLCLMFMRKDRSACEGIEIEVTETGIWVSHANTPEGDLNLRQFIEELERGGIAVEAQSFYCG